LVVRHLDSVKPWDGSPDVASTLRAVESSSFEIRTSPFDIRTVALPAALWTFHFTN
jgi:hypothetical protein